MKLNTKLMVGFMTCVMISGIVGGIGIFAIKKGNNTTTAILNEDFQNRDLSCLIEISLFFRKMRKAGRINESVADSKPNDLFKTTDIHSETINILL